MKNLENKRVLIFQQRSWGITIGSFLARKLQSEGCVLAALTFKNTTLAKILEQEDVQYKRVDSHDEIMSDPLAYLGGERYSLEEICSDLGIDSIWPMVSSLRNHVRCYKDKYYYSFRQNVSDEEILLYVQAVYKYTKKVFQEFAPELIISPNFVSFPHIFINLYGERRGVDMLAMTDSKVRGFFLLSRSYNDDKGSFYEHLDKIRAGKTVSSNMNKAKKYIADFRKEFKAPISSKIENDGGYIRQLRKVLSPYYHIFKWYTTKNVNVNKSTGITLDYKPPRIILRDHYMSILYARYMRNRECISLDDINKFIYFPLQFQPEASIDVAAPYFSNQIETVRQVAMSLPNDYTLVVKEHPNMVGFRPPSYIEKVARTVNVKLIDYRIPSEVIFKKMDMIVSPNSTSIAEAAFYNKPAIQLGNLGTTKKLPNVFTHQNMTTLSGKILEVLGNKLDTEEYEKGLEEFVAAVFDMGYDYNYNLAWEKNGENMEDLWLIYREELVRLPSLK
jgi:hypothetical protein